MKNKEALLLLGEAYIPIQKTRYLLEFIERYSLTLPIQLHEYILIWYHEVVFPDDGKISRKESEKTHYSP